MQHIKITHS